MNLTATLIGQSITFIVFVAFCMKYVWPAFVRIMAEREKRITEGLQNAERADKDLELAKNKAAEHVREAKEQASEIVEQARRRANQMVEQASTDAKVEAERVRAQAEANLEQEISRAREKLRGEVVALALVGAERVLADSVDATKHSAMLEKLAAQL